jgi:hypothetical protein
VSGHDHPSNPSYMHMCNRPVASPSQASMLLHLGDDIAILALCPQIMAILDQTEGGTATPCWTLPQYTHQLLSSSCCW